VRWVTHLKRTPTGAFVTTKIDRKGITETTSRREGARQRRRTRTRLGKKPILPDEAGMMKEGNGQYSGKAW